MVCLWQLGYLFNWAAAISCQDGTAAFLFIFSPKYLISTHGTELRLDFFLCSGFCYRIG